VSRTFNTTPLRVRLAQDLAVRRERHDHRLHDCNLPTILELAREDNYAARWASCWYTPSRRYGSLQWHCDCSYCEYHGATPPRSLRRSGRAMTRRAAGRVPDAELLDEIDDVATPRR
jgi:hypothetical protein